MATFNICTHIVDATAVDDDAADYDHFFFRMADEDAEHQLQFHIQLVEPDEGVRL